MEKVTSEIYRIEVEGVGGKGISSKSCLLVLWLGLVRQNDFNIEEREWRKKDESNRKIIYSRE